MYVFFCFKKDVWQIYKIFYQSLNHASLRLKNFIEVAAKATLVGDVFDDAATGQGLLNFFIKAYNCGAIGEKEVIEAFIGVSNISDEDVEEARSIYSRLDIEDFYEWASHHFAIDDFYDDEEDLIDHIKFKISSDNTHLFNDKKYKFITEIIGRSAQSYRYLG